MFRAWLSLKSDQRCSWFPVTFTIFEIPDYFAHDCVLILISNPIYYITNDKSIWINFSVKISLSTYMMARPIGCKGSWSLSCDEESCKQHESPLKKEEQYQRLFAIQRTPYKWIRISKYSSRFNEVYMFDECGHRVSCAFYILTAALTLPRCTYELFALRVDCPPEFTSATLGTVGYGKKLFRLSLTSSFGAIVLTWLLPPGTRRSGGSEQRRRGHQNIASETAHQTQEIEDAI